MVRWLRWHCSPDTEFEIRALAVWDRARYLSVTEAPNNTDFHTWMGKKHFCFFQTAETGNRTPNSGVKGSGANHYPAFTESHLCRAKTNSRSSLYETWQVTAICLWPILQWQADVVATFTALNYFCINNGGLRVFSIWSDHKCLKGDISPLI